MPDTPELSVVIPTFGRSETVARLLESLDRQTLAPERFEVIVVDDGSPEPIALDPGAHRYRLTLLRQANAGPGAARNRAIAAARGALCLILDDDAVPAPELLAGHLAAHAEAPPKTAILGTFQFTAQARRSPFVQVLAASSLLFDFPNRHHGKAHGWTFFWTCLLSLPTAVLHEHPFDERFSPRGFEDVDFTLRATLAGFRNRLAQDVFVRHVDYGGARCRRHEELLARNGSRFAEKCSGRSDLAHGDYASIESAIVGVHSREALYVPFQSPAAALPAGAVRLETAA